MENFNLMTVSKNTNNAFNMVSERKTTLVEQLQNRQLHTDYTALDWSNMESELVKLNVVIDKFDDLNDALCELD